MEFFGGDCLMNSIYARRSLRFESLEDRQMLSAAGDYNNNGEVDAADYVMWRKLEGTQTQYDTWSSRFGKTAQINWFDTNIQDAALSELGSDLYADGLISRLDILSLLDSVGDDSLVDAVEFADLSAIVSNVGLFGEEQSVLQLASYVINGTTANAKYQGANLGNLAAGTSDTKLDKLVNKWFLGLDRPVANGTYQQMAGRLFVDGAQYTDIRQGSVGDCYLVCALAEIALKTPDTIHNMFVVNGDGTYSVKFYRDNGTSVYVTVDSYLPTDSTGKLTYSGRGLSFNDPDAELWVALAEKAYAQLNEFGFSRAGFLVSGQNTYAALDGGYIYAALTHVTGLPTTPFTFTSGTENFTKFVEAYNAGKLIGFATYSNPPTPGIVSNHAYAVIGYNSENQTITLFNPWGIEYGLTTMTWSQITPNFMYFDRTS